jgi:hypothetical protein
MKTAEKPSKQPQEHLTWVGYKSGGGPRRRSLDVSFSENWVSEIVPMVAWTYRPK